MQARISVRLSFPITFLIVSLSILLSGSAHGAGVTLGWNPPVDDRVAGYRVYYGISGTEYKNTPRVTVNSPTQTSTGISGLEQGETYRFAMTSFDADGKESVFSEEVSYTVPVDSDGDGVSDAKDLCPNDPDKIEPGSCGCGVADTDTDSDGIPDCNDTGDVTLPPVGDDGGSAPPPGGDSGGSEPPVVENTAPDAPILLSPPDLAYGVGKQFSFEAGNFYDPDGDAHKATEWQIALDSNFSVLVLAQTEEKKLTRLFVSHVLFDEATTYHWRVRYKDDRGAFSPWSDTYTFTTGDWFRDKDQNGIADANELDKSLPVDLDANGVIDTEQTDIKSLQATRSAKQIGVESTEGQAVEYIESLDPLLVDDQLNKPDRTPFGLIDFRMAVDPGQTVTVAVYLSEAVPENARWYKYDGVAGWQDYSSRARFSPDRKTVELTLTDGGPGDADGVVNGIIVDPSGVGISALADDGSQGGSDSGGGGGGCFIRSLFSFF